VLQPAVRYCGNVAVAAFKVGYPGPYHLEVLQLYQGFSYAAPTFGIADIHAAYHTFNTTMTGVTGTPCIARPCHLQPYPASEAAVQAGGLQVNSSSLNPATVAASSVSTAVMLASTSAAGPARTTAAQFAGVPTTWDVGLWHLARTGLSWPMCSRAYSGHVLSTPRCHMTHSLAAPWVCCQRWSQRPKTILCWSGHHTIAGVRYCSTVIRCW
jgi:hypothetical protein